MKELSARPDLEPVRKQIARTAIEEPPPNGRAVFDGLAVVGLVVAACVVVAFLVGMFIYLVRP